MTITMTVGTKSIYQDSKHRSPSQRDQIVKRLRMAGRQGVANTDLVKMCIGYRSRIAELYQMGYKIDVVNLEGGVVQYILRKEPKVIQCLKSKPTAISMLVESLGEDVSEVLIQKLEELNLSVVRKSGAHKKDVQ